MTKRETEDIRRLQILDTAKRCIARQGYHQTTMDKIAEEAGLSKGALYWYFKSKDDILVDLCRQMNNEYITVFHHFASQRMPVRELVLKTGERLLDLMLKESDSYKVFLEFWALSGENKEIKKALGEVHAAWEEILSYLIKSGIKGGEIKHGIKVKEFSSAILALFNGLEIVFMVGKVQDVKAVWHTAISAIFDGIAKDWRK